MNFTRSWAIFLRQMFIMRRNKTRFLSIFYWPILDILLWGIATVYFDKVGKAEFSFLTVIVGALLLWNFLIRIQQGMTLGFLEDVWARNFLNLFASPLTIAEYVAGVVLIGLTTSGMSLVAMALFAWIFFAYNIFTVGFALLPFLLILFLFGLALGIVTVALMLRVGPAGEWIAWAIPFSITPFVGVFYPISALPKILHPIANILPASYVFEGMRGVVLQGTFSFELFLAGTLLGILYLIFASWILVRVYRSALKKGFLTRFTAENF